MVPGVCEHSSAILTSQLTALQLWWLKDGWSGQCLSPGEISRLAASWVQHIKYCKANPNCSAVLLKSNESHGSFHEIVVPGPVDSAANNEGL